MVKLFSCLSYVCIIIRVSHLIETLPVSTETNVFKNFFEKKDIILSFFVGGLKEKKDCQIHCYFLFRYKKELSAAVEREASLERSKAQLELDWQRRFEDLERQQYEKSEDLIRKLTRSRDEVKIL